MKYFESNNMGLRYPNANVKHFATWQWDWNPHIYLAYRLFMFLYFAGWLLYTGWTYRGLEGYFFIYFSNWSFFILTAHLFCSFAVALSFYWQNYSKGEYRKTETGPEAYQEDIPITIKIHWVLYYLALLPAVMISLNYWILVHNQEQRYMGVETVQVHLVNGIYAFVEIALVATPVRLEHVWITMVYGASWSIFNVLFYFAGGENEKGCRCVYNLTHLGHYPLWTVFATLTTIFCVIPATHGLIYGVYRLRMALYRHLAPRDACALVDPTLQHVHSRTSQIPLEEAQQL